MCELSSRTLLSASLKGESRRDRDNVVEVVRIYPLSVVGPAGAACSAVHRSVPIP